MSERNERYIAKHQYGFGSVLSEGEADALKTLNVPQIEALLNMILWGDIHEIGTDEDVLGKMASNQRVPRCMADVEGETRVQTAAALVYLSGHLAEDIPLLTEEPPVSLDIENVN